HHFGAPIVGISATDLLPWAGARMGNPDNPSYVPNYFLSLNEQMVLHEKLQAFFALFLTKIGYFFLSTAASEIRAREFFGNHLPSLETIVSNTSLLLVNSHISVNVPRPMVPNVVEVGGLHIEPSDSLPPELDEIVRTSSDGVVYFSMGTVID
ncbi:glucuronosyltransferase, partial [Oryctes borbonicus]